MRNTLLTSPDFIRMNSNISDNLNSKVLATAIREVQDTELLEILGQDLLEYLQYLVEEDLIEEDQFSNYKQLLDNTQYFITYKVIAEITVMVAVKIDNAGLMQSRDEMLDYIDINNTFILKNYYDQKADHYAYLLQDYLLRNKSLFPELTQCQCNKIKATLYSAANAGVFLGGARGRGIHIPCSHRC